MEPVQIDITLNQNVESEGKKATSSVKELAEGSLYARKEAKESLKQQEQYFAALQKKIRDLKSSMKDFGDIKPDSRLFQNKLENDPALRERYELYKKTKHALRELTSSVKEEEEALKKLRRQVQINDQNHSVLIRRLRGVRAEMMELRAAGRVETEQYKNLQVELEELSLAYRNVIIEQRAFAKGASMIHVVTALQGVAGAVSTLSGVIGLFTNDSEKLQKVQKNLQAAIAMAVGIQQVQVALSQKQTFVTHILSGAIDAYKLAVARLTVMLRGATVWANALMATATLGLSALVTGAIVGINSVISKMKEQEEMQNKISESTSEDVSSQIASYEKLRRTYSKLGNDLQAKEKFLKKNRDEIRKLGEEVKDLDRADEIFISRSKQFVEALKYRAKAMALMDIIKERYREAVKKELEAKEREGEITFLDSLIGVTGKGAEARAKKAAGNIRSVANAMYRAADPLWELHEAWNKAADDLFTLRDPEEKEKDKSKSLKKQVDERRRAQERLRAMSLEIEKDKNSSIIAATEAGRDKRIAAINNEYNERKKIIKKKLEEIEQLERDHGINGSKQKKSLQDLRAAYEEERVYKIDIDTQKAEKEIKEVRRLMTERFEPEEGRLLSDIDEKYKGLFEKVKSNAESQQEMQTLFNFLEEQRTKEHHLTLMELQLKRLDFENQIAEKRAEIAAEDMIFDSDKEAAVLNARLESAKLRLQKLEEIKKGGGQADEAIGEAKLRIDELTAALNRIPAKRVEEIGKNVKGIFSSLAKAPGDLGRVFEGLSQSVDKVMASFAKGTSNWDRAAAAISGIMDLWSMAEEQAKKNAQAEKEYAEVVLATQHRAAKMRLDALKHKGSNPWGVEDPYARAIAGAKRYREAMAELNKSVERLSQGQVQVGLAAELSGENAAKGLAAGAGIGSAVGAGIGSVVPVIGTMIGGVVGGIIGGIAGGIFGLTRKKMVPVFKSLTEQYGTILKAGTKSFELNPKILEDYDKLDAATKKLVDNWQSVRDEAIKAQEEMEANFKDLTGDLGSMLSRALADGFRNGDIYAAMDDFESELDKMIGRIVEQMVFAAYFQQVFDELRERMKQSFNEGGDGTIADDMIWFSRTYRKGLEGYKKAMEETKTELEKQGINAFTPERSAAARKGLAQASQDSIDALSGIITNISSRVEDLVSIAQVNRQADEARMVVFRQMALHVEIIAANSTFLHRLEDIASDLSTMNRDGINLKK